ncbi:hypothetical protein FHQ18_09375 [Deferribacter autotrophicus]|uniref:Uncharacterized protein n=1 Tax=Deferribacter autotrophicus TaxID=500465 RepID=A0A5A8F4M3_9BACT|nr:Dna2/Cas4 domain-containing protein [Deferribacter autotrophicus]KAA0257543.1 hypothetical protein FHQ18_09375 [Deferribacter autotrophicus]
MIHEIIKKYLPKIIKEKSEIELGNRKEYIGASDIAQCSRKVVLSKLNPVEHDVETLIRLQRGHLTENLLKMIFDKTPYKYTTQMELTHPDLPYLKAHLDFVFYTKDMSKIGVLELKTVSSMPDEPHESWIQQLHFQLGLMILKYPDAEIKGSVLVININTGEMKEFNNYEPNNVIFNALLEKAKKIKMALDGQIEPKTEQGFLCSSCPYKTDCPALIKGEKVEFPDDMKQRVKKLKELVKIEKETKSLKNEIKLYMESIGIKTGIADDIIVQYQSRKGRKTLDEKALKEAYPEIDITPFYKEGDPYSFITLK